MITVLYGENYFEIDREMRRIIAEFPGDTQQVEGETLSLQDLPSLLLGTTLFSDNRLIIIRRLSENRPLWAVLSDYVEQIPKENHLLLVEATPDKRTKTFKQLQKFGDMKHYKVWGDREAAVAERWVEGESKRLGVRLEAGAARLLVRRSLVVSDKNAVIDQWRLMSSLEKLAPLGTIRTGDVEEYIEDAPVENVFTLLETALRGESGRVKEMVKRLEATEDPFRLFGLLSGQAFWLAVLAVSSRPNEAVAKDFSTHPFILAKLSPYAKALGPGGARQIAHFFAEADAAMKTSAADSWLLIERTLVKTATVRTKKKSA